MTLCQISTILQYNAVWNIIFITLLDIILKRKLEVITNGQSLFLEIMQNS